MTTKGSVWCLRDEPHGEFEIMLPTNRELGDFAIRMSEALHTLAVAEGRAISEVYQDLTAGSRTKSAVAG